jgi:hypothetical protein
MPDLLGEPRLQSDCPVQPSLSGGAGAEHLVMPRPPSSPPTDASSCRPGHARCAVTAPNAWHPHRGPSARSGWAGFTRVQQATVPRKQAIFARAPQAVARFEARHCVAFINRFSIDLIHRISTNFQNLLKLVGVSKKYKINFIWIHLNHSTQWAWQKSVLWSKLLYKIVRTQI